MEQDGTKPTSAADGTRQPWRREPEPEKSYISVWSIAILSATCAWFGWRYDNPQVILASVAGMIAFLTFLCSPKTAIRTR